MYKEEAHNRVVGVGPYFKKPSGGGFLQLFSDHQQKISKALEELLGPWDILSA